ncbi:tail fiber domain-containing protein [Flavobacterium stagni]|uniref:Peptidase S74 domain-containing protein n=1 Tax=Flavobacterium stagni TaxID=2506421 RepID=A0A4Q1KCV8_9FLAO|nr:tail fiber domain-containing protein [Flavobacterium stagni]RXR24073.1 hypothetical protein EQG61_01150 [Flavobacterium stagni]
MKRIVYFLFILIPTFCFSQVGVNTTNPDPSSMLDITSTDKGVLVPRVSLTSVATTSLDGTNTAATGLLIWNTNAATTGGNGVGFYFFNGTQWMPITQSGTGNTLDQSYDQGGAGVGRTITADAGAVTINGTDGLVTTGIFGNGAVAPSGAGTKMYFNPKKAAFRAGNVNGTQWDDVNIGNYSMALGQNVIASGSNSVAFGGSTTASGSSSAAFGSVSYATSDAAFVAGIFNSASGVASTAFGYRSVASGVASTALGNDNYARSFGETVIGIGATDYTPINTVNSFPSSATDRLFVVGNGIDSNSDYITQLSERSNALVILKNGETGLGANPITGNRLTVGGKTSTTNFQMTSGATANYILQSDSTGNATWVNPSTLNGSDHDIYEVGGTTAPNSISDNKYTEGTLSIGTNTAATGVLDIDNATKTTSVDINNTFATNPIGIDLNLTSNAAGKTGVKTQFNGTAATGTNSFIQNTDNMVGNTNRTAINNDFSGTSSSISTTITGLKNDFKSTSNYYAVLYGVNNSFASTTNAWGYGMLNSFTNGGSTPSFGVVNSFNGSSSGSATGISNSSNNYNGAVTGLENSFSGIGNGIHYGISNSLTGTGSGDKYGTYNYISNTAGGTHYGLYSNVLKTGSYAGYFLGNVSIGTTTSNNYILPTSRGTNGQIMQTDGSGNVSWVNSVVDTDTDDQTTDVFSLTGNTLNLSLQNDGVATQTVDLSPLKDHDWYEVGGTSQPDLITDNIYKQGSVTIGTNTAATGVLDIDNASKIISLDVNNTFSANPIGVNVDINSTSGTKTGIEINHSGIFTGFGGVGSMIKTTDNSSGNNNRFVMYNIFNGTSTDTNTNSFGIRNSFIANSFVGDFIGVDNYENSTSNGDRYGLNNLFAGTGSGTNYGVYNYISGSGSGTKYGVYNTILSTAGGTHYGLYSNVLKTGSYAGYFLGNVSIGTTAGNSYILPPSRGTNGQIMQTDGSGNVSWVSPTITTDTDDQQIDVLSLTGDTLNISLQDDAVATQTLNLSSIDNQATDIFSLTGTTLNLSLQNDGVATQTVDLSPLKDHDWYEVGGLTPADSILDNIYTGGDVSIGKATAATAKIDIVANAKLNTLNLENNNATSGTKNGIYNVLTTNNNNNFSTGILNNVTGNAPSKAAITNQFFTNNSGAAITEYGNLTTSYSTGNVNLIGNSNYVYPSTSCIGNIIGYENVLSGMVLGSFVGLSNFNWTFSNSQKTGVSNNFNGDGNGGYLGVDNSFGGISNGEIIGVGTIITNTGMGEKYGEKIWINNSSPGTHYGIYSDVTKTGSYAGYFLGRTSIGTTTANNYILPASRGTNGQTMQTDALGNVSWVNLPTDSDNQATDVFSLTGNTLNLSLQNDGVATQTVDLSSFANDWKLSGNAGTLSGTDFIGTTDAQDLDFRTNNTIKLKLTQQGQLSIQNTGGSVFVGAGSGNVDDLTNNQNTFIGTNSGSLTSTGNLNTAIGHSSLEFNTSGLGNTAIGRGTLATNVIGSNNTALGRLADVSADGLSNATAIGFNSVVNSSAKVRIGNTAVTVIEGQVAYTNPSDARFKFNIQENVPGLDFIQKLKPVTYNFDTKKFEEHLNKSRNHETVANEDFTKSTAIVRTGFLAQDVEKICNDLGYNFDGLHIPDANNPTDNYGIAYSQFIMPLVKAVQEQQVIIENQKIELEKLQNEINKIRDLEQRINALEAKK